MKIKKLKLKDFGPHKSLEVDLDANIVGIIGPNGSGKSNLLQAINYALTGDLNKTNQVKYIRNFGIEGGAKKAVVELTFEKGGEEGKIIREIGATTSKRCLTWEGEEYHKQDDVDRVLAGIMAADKAVLTNAVFIKQGSIANLIQGTPSERQEIFQKLFHLSFVGKLDQELQSKIAMLQSGIIDYAPQIALLSEQRKALIDEQEALAKAIEAFGTFESTSMKVGDYIAAADESSALAATLREAGAALNTAKSALAAAEEEAKQVTGAAPLSNTISALEAELARYQEAERISTQWRNALQAVESVANDVERVKDKLIALDTRRPIEVDREEAEKVSKRLGEALGFLSERERLTVLVSGFENSVSAHMESVTGLKEARAAAVAVYNERAAVLSKRIQTAEIAEKILCLKLDALSLGVTATCPLCGSPMHTDSTETEEHIRKALAAARLDSEVASQELNSLRADMIRADAEFASESKSLSRAVQAQEEHELQLKEYAAWPFDDLPEDKAVLLARRDALSTALQEYVLYGVKREAIVSEVESAQERFAAAEARLQVAKDSAANLGYTTEEELAAAAAKQFGCASRLNTLRAHDAKIMTLLESVGTATERKAMLEQSLRATQQNVDTYGASPDVQGYIKHWEALNDAPFEITDTTRRRSMMELIGTEQGKLDAHRERSSAITDQLDDLDSRLGELINRQSKNDRRVELIRMLQMSREVVGKNGAPKDYCSHVFNQITDVVQSLLVEMGANFTVEPDPDRPMTYSFVRTDNDDGYSMGQERLSGGQAIRLAMALLIACQQMVLPDVGLLVLDEPSSHIDSEGVANMRDMMLSLNTLLEAADMQLILVDHNETLNAAFGKTIQLADLRNAQD